MPGDGPGEHDGRVSDPQLPDDADGDVHPTGVRESAIFSRCVASMLRTTQLDPERVKVALQAQNDQVLAALREALRPGSTQSQRLLALVDVYMHATWEMVWQASRSPDRRLGNRLAHASILRWRLFNACA